MAPICGEGRTLSSQNLARKTPLGFATSLCLILSASRHMHTDCDTRVQING